METNQNVYCRLEIFCDFNLISSNQPNSSLEKSLHDSVTDVYVENYKTFSQVKKRILELTNVWLERDPEEKAYWNEEARNNLSYRDSCSPRFLIFNRWNKITPLGITYKGWYIGFLFYGYSAEYIASKYGKDKVEEIVWREKFNFMAPEHTQVNELDLMSEKTAELFITEWLEKETVSEEFMQQIFQAELKSRKFF
jgi:hypothetical protein